MPHRQLKAGTDLARRFVCVCNPARWAAQCPRSCGSKVLSECTALEWLSGLSVAHLLSDCIHLCALQACRSPTQGLSICMGCTNVHLFEGGNDARPISTNTGISTKKHKARCMMAAGNRSLGSAALQCDPHWAATWHPPGTKTSH